MSEFNKNHHLISDVVFDVSSKYALLLVIFIFILSCSNKEDNGNSTSSVTVTPGIKVVNSSSRFSTSDITVLTNTASSKMSNQAANILAVSWDLGSTSQTSDSRNENFNTYNVVISSSDIDAIMSEITAWFDTTCMTSEDKTEQTTRFKNYMTYGTDEILQLQPRKFNWIDNSEEQNGFIAQEVESVLPNFVATGDMKIDGHEEEEGIKSVNYNSIVATLVKSVQELEARIAELENG